MRVKKLDKILFVRMDDKLIEKIRKLSSSRGMTSSQFVRWLLERYRR